MKARAPSCWEVNFKTPVTMGALSKVVQIEPFGVLTSRRNPVPSVWQTSA